MSLFAGNRNICARTIGATALALAAGGLLVACGSDDSTATSNPVTSSSAAASSSNGSATGSASASASATTSASASTSPGAAATAPPEQPQSIEGFPGPTVVDVSPEAQKFLDGLKARGITPAGDGSIAVNTANYICAAGPQTDDEVLTFVTAFVGQEASVAGKELSPEQAGANAQIYIDVANTTYCK